MRRRDDIVADHRPRHWSQLSRRALCFRAGVLAVLLASVAPAFGQRNSPLSPEAIALPEVGRMIGTITTRLIRGTGEEFGRHIFPIGDVDHDGLNDWILSRKRCDTLVQMPTASGGVWERNPRELILYRGIPGGLTRRTACHTST
jgi:hypothetical protein